jgi:hypothetical protein
MSANSRIVDEAATGENRLVDFETELIKDLTDLHVAYERNIQSIGGLCSLTSQGEPSIDDYMHWPAAEVACLPEVFASVNENFVSAAIEGVLMMPGDSVDLAALQASAADSGADVLPVE